MSTEPDDTEDEELAEYEPEPVGLSEGDVMIFDKAEFEQDFNCYAAMNSEGTLFVLCKDKRKWVPAEGRGQLQAPRPTRVQ